MIQEMQLRLVYSLLKPAVRAAARFNLPIRPFIELVRLAYFEHLKRQGMSAAEIAQHFGQSTRHMRTLAQRLESDFFQAERDVGLMREVEAKVAETTPTDQEIAEALPSWRTEEVEMAIAQLLEEDRIERREDGRLQTAQHYVIFSTEAFYHRIDSLNHFMDGAYRAVLHRMVYDDHQTAMTKAISFSSVPSELIAYVAHLEGELRRELATLDESATFQGQAERRFTLMFAMAPVTEEPLMEPQPTEQEETP
ncbi:MAG: hypothetical protein AAFX99_17375 [Myxococcota bacterium]